MVVIILLLFKFVVYPSVYAIPVNNRPIIGIMAEELSGNSMPLKGSFIMSYNVKFIEASGARVVPIHIYKPKEYYYDILNKVNGVLFPGGADVLSSKGYGRAGKIIYDIAVQMNNAGDYFPIMGICLGFELLNLVPMDKLWMKACQADDIASNINLVKDYKQSRMFSSLPDDLKNKMKNKKLSIHFHHWCMTLQNYTLSGLDKYYKVLSLSKDLNNETFINIIEAIQYPFYGVAFHPEKVVFDWSAYNVSIPHTTEAIETSQYLGNFFINEARKNTHHFPSEKVEQSALIYNYNTTIIGPDTSAQAYLFPFT